MPASLAIPDQKRLPGLGMQIDHLLEKHSMCVRDVLDRLTLQRVGDEADEVDGVTRLEGPANLAYRLETPDARPLAGTRNIPASYLF